MNAATFLSRALLIPAALLITSCADVGDTDKATTGSKVEVETEGGDQTYVIDTAASRLDWVAAKITRSHDGGFNEFSGTISTTNGDVSYAKIDIDPSSIFSDDEKLTGHLKSPDFFNVETHKSAQFEASTFEKADTAGFTHRVTGNLTMLETTKSITFPATITVSPGSVTAKADFIINRKEWKIVYPGAPDDLINDEVRLKFDVVAKPAAGSTGS